MRILLVEDEPSDAALVVELLDDEPTRHMTVDHVASLDALSSHMASDEMTPDAILLDLSLPESRGLDTLAHAATITGGVPIVVLTGLMDDAVGLRAIEQGAQDYLRKDQLDGPLLARALQFAIERSRNRALLAAVLRSQSDAVLVIGADGRAVLRNPAAETLTGYAPRGWAARITADPADARALTDAASTGETWSRTITGHGGRHFDVRIGPLSDGSTGGVVAIRDVTRAVERQHRIEALNAALQRHLTQKTELLVRLERADTIRARFVDAVSHELRTPLTPIKGFSDLLLRNRREPLTARQTAAVEAIRSSAGRLERIVESMLDFQTLQRTAEPLSPTPVDVRRLLDRLADEARRRVAERPIVIELEADAELPSRLLLDETRLTEALLRLVDNAARFTREGRIALGARWHGAELHCVVTDTGVGIPPEHVDAIFTAFYQVDPGLSGRDGGIGLGLAHAQALLRSMRGEIAVQSAPGAGSSFVARLPARPVV